MRQILKIGAYEHLIRTETEAFEVKNGDLFVEKDRLCKERG